jgi:hypothetical protein
MRFDDWDYEETLTFQQLKERVDSDWEDLGEEGQHRWFMDPSPTFEQYVIGMMKPEDSVLINYDKYTYEIIKT